MAGILVGILALGLSAACGSDDDSDELPAEEATAQALATLAAEVGFPIERDGAGDGAPGNGTDDGTGTGDGDGPGATEREAWDAVDPDSDPGGGADEGPVSTEGDGFLFVVESPESASGPFTATVVIAEASERYRAFNIEIRYDPELLRVTSVEHAGILGASESVICPTLIQNELGKALLACTTLGDISVDATGPAARFHFEPVGTGTSPLNLTTLAQAGTTHGAYVVDPDQQLIQAGTRGTEIRITQ